MPSWSWVRYGPEAHRLPPRGQVHPLDHLTLIINSVQHLDPESVNGQYVDLSWVLSLFDPVHFQLQLAVPEEKVKDESKVKEEDDAEVGEERREDDEGRGKEEEDDDPVRYHAWVRLAGRIYSWTRLQSITYTNCRVQGTYSRVAYLFLADLSAISTSNHKIDLIYDLTQNYEHLLAPLEHEPGKEDAIILPPRLNNEFFRETSIFQIFSSIGRRHGLFGSPKPEKDADIDFLDVVSRIIVKVSLDEEKTFYGEELSRMLDRLEEDKEIIAEMVAKLPASMVVPGNAEKGLAKAREIVFESIEGTI